MSHLTEHGYVVLFALVFAQAIGVPVPAALALLVAGGASAKGPLQLSFVLLTAFSSMLGGDALLYFLGRHTGWWLLGILCKLSVDPDGCVLRYAESFRRKGRLLLVFGKLLPGINSLAPPLAGSMNMGLAQFFALDAAGAALYTLAFCGAGFFCSDFMGTLTKRYQAAGSVLASGLATVAVVYFGYHLWLLLRARSLGYVPRVTASEVARRFYGDLHRDMAVFDVRSHGYYSRRVSRIQGSARLDPNTLLQELERLPKDKEIILYCTCNREATSLQVARILQQHGLRSSIIQGGLRAWNKGGFPLETVPEDEIVLLPRF